MAKKKEINRAQQAQVCLEEAKLLLEEQYKENPKNELYTVFSQLELLIREIKKI